MHFVLVINQCKTLLLWFRLKERNCFCVHSLFFFARILNWTLSMTFFTWWFRARGRREKKRNTYSPNPLIADWKAANRLTLQRWREKIAGITLTRIKMAPFKSVPRLRWNIWGRRASQTALRSATGWLITMPEPKGLSDRVNTEQRLFCVTPQGG